MNESNDREKRRVRAALMSLSGGVILIVWAWVSWIYRNSIPPRANDFAGPVEDPATATDGAMAQMTQLIYVVVVVLLAAFIALMAFSRGWRRYMGFLLRRKPRPTQSDCTWEMHRLPEDELTHGTSSSSD